MTSTPSHLGHQILNDICPSITPLVGCHCADTVLGIWRRSLPQVVRNAIANLDFNSNSFDQVFDRADSVWSSNSASSSVVATLTTKSGEEEVAAVSTRGGRRNRGGRGRNRGGSAGCGRSGNSGNQASGTGVRSRGPRHPDNPPSQACDIHWKFGKAAWHYADRHGCPWRDLESPRPRHNRNIVAETEIIE